MYSRLVLQGLAPLLPRVLWKQGVFLPNSGGWVATPAMPRWCSTQQTRLEWQKWYERKAMLLATCATVPSPFWTCMRRGPPSSKK